MNATKGGFRCAWLARLTRGRIGLGRWTQEEVDSINARAKEEYDSLFPPAKENTDD